MQYMSTGMERAHAHRLNTQTVTHEHKRAPKHLIYIRHYDKRYRIRNDVLSNGG